jgi:hypothetical protein
MSANDGVKAAPQIICGPPGAGKSYYIKSYAEKHGLDVLVCPCRIDRTLREQRTKLHEWAHRLQPSLLWLEGADDLTPEAQSFLRRILETYSPSVHFILECRTIESIQEPIRSRCTLNLIQLPTQDELFAFAAGQNIPFEVTAAALSNWPPSKCTWRQIANLKYKPNIYLNQWNTLEKELHNMSQDVLALYLRCRHLGGNPIAFNTYKCALLSAAKKDN